MTFEDTCPAFRAYNALDRLPKNAPPFSFTADGYPITTFGERYCRVPLGSDGGLCGKIVTQARRLDQHLRLIHKIDGKLRPPRKTGSGTAERRERDIEFYKEIMKDEVYDDTALTSEEVKERRKERKDEKEAKRETHRKRKEVAGRVVNGGFVAAADGERKSDEGRLGEEDSVVKEESVAKEGDVLFKQVALGEDDGTPIDETPIDGTRIDGGLIEGTPIDETPIEATPVDIDPAVEAIEEPRVMPPTWNGGRKRKRSGWLPSNFPGEVGGTIMRLDGELSVEPRQGDRRTNPVVVGDDEDMKVEKKTSLGPVGEHQDHREASIVVDSIESAKPEDEALGQQHEKREDHDGQVVEAIPAVERDSGIDLEHEQEVQGKHADDQDEGDTSLAEAQAFLKEMEGYSGVMDLIQTPSRRIEPMDDDDGDVDAKKLVISVEKQSPELASAPTINRSPSLQDGEDEIVVRSPYFSKTKIFPPKPTSTIQGSPDKAVLRNGSREPASRDAEDEELVWSPYFSRTKTFAPEPVSKQGVPKNPFDWKQFAAKPVDASEPVQNDEDDDDDERFDEESEDGEDDGEDEEISQIKKSRSRLVHKMASWKRKEAEAQMELLDLDQKLAEVRKRARRE